MRNVFTKVLLARESGVVVQFIRYGLMSGVALGVDVGFLYLLNAVLGVHYVVAASVSFFLGMVVVYFGSIFWAFNERRIEDVRQEVVIFASIGLAGLVINGLLIALLVEVFSLPVMVAKGCAVIFVFLFNFSMRKWLLFVKG